MVLTQALANWLGAYYLVGLTVSLIIFVFSRHHPVVRGMPVSYLVMSVLVLSLVWPLIFLEMDNDDGNWRG